MAEVTFERVAVPATAVLYAGLALVLPLARLWLRTRRWVIPRAAGPRTQTFVGGALVATLVFFLVCSAAYGLAGPEALGVWPLGAVSTALGWFLQFGGLVIVVIAQAQMGESWRLGVHEEPTVLVTRGVFRLVRNPIYSGLMLSGLGFFLRVPSIATAIGSLVLAVGLHVQTRLEEGYLKRVCAATFLPYAGRVGRFLPGVGLPGAAGKLPNGACGERPVSPLAQVALTKDTVRCLFSGCSQRQAP